MKELLSASPTASISKVHYPGPASEALIEMARKERDAGAVVSMENKYDGTRWWLEVLIVRSPK